MCSVDGCTELINNNICNNCLLNRKLENLDNFKKSIKRHNQIIASNYFYKGFTYTKDNILKLKDKELGIIEEIERDILKFVNKYYKY
jgi:hypothetical protein